MGPVAQWQQEAFIPRLVPKRNGGGWGKRKHLLCAWSKALAFGAGYVQITGTIIPIDDAGTHAPLEPSIVRGWHSRS